MLSLYWENMKKTFVIFNQPPHCISVQIVTSFRSSAHDTASITRYRPSLPDWTRRSWVMSWCGRTARSGFMAVGRSLRWHCSSVMPACWFGLCIVKGTWWCGQGAIWTLGLQKWTYRGHLQSWVVTHYMPSYSQKWRTCN